MNEVEVKLPIYQLRAIVEFYERIKRDGHSTSVNEILAYKKLKAALMENGV